MKKQGEIKDKIQGEIYFISDPKLSYDYIELWDKKNNNHPYIQLDKNNGSGLVFHGSSCAHSYCYHGRVAYYRASSEQTMWLKECIKQNKLITLGEALMLQSPIKSEGILAQVTQKFEVGKWYKNLSKFNFIAKFKKFENNNFITYGYYIDNGNYRISNSPLTSDYKNAVECSLSEIQEYLPEGHVDKIKSKGLTINGFDMSSLKNGDIIYLETGYKWITTFNEIDGNLLKGYKTIKLNSHILENYDNLIHIHNTVRLATPEEKQWLDACIKANKFISKEEALKKSEIIPEYVECIVNNSPSYQFGQIGKIYKVKDYNYSSHDLLLEDSDKGSSDRKRFNPSTKEAYDAQFKKEEEWIPKVGDWGVCKKDKVIGSEDYNYGNKSFKIVEIKGNYFKYNHTSGIDHHISCEYLLSHIRKAEPYEIPIEFKTKPNIPMYSKDNIVEESNKNLLPRFYIKYDPSITEEDFNKLLFALEKLGYCKYEHCDWKITYKNFQYYKFLRISVQTEKLIKNGFCIDNNHQNINIERNINFFINKDSKESLLEEAKKRYPIGTKFYVAHLGGVRDNQIGTIESTESLKWETEKEIAIITGTNIKSGWSKCVYFEGKWAEIISTPETFNKEEIFKLPEKWYIKTCNEVGDWLDNNYSKEVIKGTYTYKNTSFKYLCYPSYNRSHIHEALPIEYKEITLEQFQKYVLKNLKVEGKLWTTNEYLPGISGETFNLPINYFMSNKEIKELKFQKPIIFKNKKKKRKFKLVIINK